MKKTEIKPVRILSREAMQSAVSRVVTTKLTHAELTVQMEQEVAEVQKRFQGRLDDLAKQVELEEAALQVWALEHPEEFATKKSIDLPQAVIGFRITPPRVEKKGKASWPAVAAKLAAIDIEGFDGTDYVREAPAQPDKDRLLADRNKIPKEVLRLAGISFEQDETFYIEPKSQVLEASTQVAA